MTPPEVCLNCHGAPYTSSWDPLTEAVGLCSPETESSPTRLDCLQPLGPEAWREDPETRSRIRHWMRGLTVDAVAGRELHDLHLPPVTATEDLDPCPAEERWPEWLREPHPEAIRRPWWVRQNFEALRHSPLPLRVDVGAADILLRLNARSGASLPLGSEWFGLHAGDHAELHSQQEIRDNEWNLLLRGLLEFQNIQVGIPGTMLTVPVNRIATGDFGGIHALATVPTWMLFFVQPFMVPIPPPGYDHPTAEQWEDLQRHPGLLDRCMDPTYYSENVGICPQPFVYPDRSQDTATLDLNLLALLPPAIQCHLVPLLGEDGRLPQFLNLEALLQAVLAARDLDCPASASSGTGAQDLMNFLESGELNIELTELNDLFLPGILDLGPSHGTLQVRLSPSGEWLATLDDFEIALDPMGYGAAEARPPRVEIHSGSILPGEAPAEGSLGIADPGIHLRFNPETGELSLSANLQVEMDITLPFAGPSYLSGNLTLAVQLFSTPQGWLWQPGTSTVSLSDIDLISRDGDRPLLQDGEIFLSDDSFAVDPYAALRYMAGPDHPAYFRMTGTALGRHAVFLEGAIPVPENPQGGIDFEGLLSALEISGTFQVLNPGNRGIRGSLRAAYSRHDADPTGERTHREFRMSLEADRVIGGRGEILPLIRGGLLIMERDREHEAHERRRILVAADHLGWGSFRLSGVQARLEVEDITLSPGESRITIPTFSLLANTEGSSGGLVRGPIRIEQRDSDWTFIWTGPERRLEMSGLDVSLSGQRLYLLPDSFRRTLAPEIASLGIDGRLRGHFTIFLPDDPRCIHGDGDLVLSGDSRGDIYWLDARGRRVGPPLLRGTRWRFSRINWIHTERGYALGRFRLDTIVNLAAAPGFSSPGFFASPSEPRIGTLAAGGLTLAPYELPAGMSYNNQPVLPEHFQNRIEDYLLNVWRSPDAGFSRVSPRRPRFCREREGDAR